jgi:hypothetical protein
MMPSSSLLQEHRRPLTAPMAVRRRGRLALVVAVTVLPLLAARASAGDDPSDETVAPSELGEVVAATYAFTGAPTRARPRVPRTSTTPPINQCAPTATPLEKPVEGADAEIAESFWTRKKLGGDWGGARTALGDLGISLDVRVSQYYQEVAAGGADTGGQYGGVANYVMNVDGEKIGLWKGLYLNVHATTRWGRDVLKRTGVWSLPNTELMYPQPGKYSGFGDTKLTYTKPATRLHGHLDGYDPSKAPTFKWPERLQEAKKEIRRKAEARSMRGLIPKK